MKFAKKVTFSTKFTSFQIFKGEIQNSMALIKDGFLTSEILKAEVKLNYFQQKPSIFRPKSNIDLSILL